MSNDQFHLNVYFPSWFEINYVYYFKENTQFPNKRYILDTLSPITKNIYLLDALPLKIIINVYVWDHSKSTYARKSLKFDPLSPFVRSRTP